MHVVIVRDEDGLEVRLTTVDSASGSGPVPVLQVTKGSVTRSFGPSDVMLDDIRAADLVQDWASRRSRTPEEVDAARAFLQRWPEGPQIGESS